jgi:hypothetical protein
MISNFLERGTSNLKETAMNSTTDQEAQDMSRVVMLWPTELKAQVREVVGLRGPTAFTIAAVRDRIAAHEAIQPEAKPTFAPGSMPTLEDGTTDLSSQIVAPEINPVESITITSVVTPEPDDEPASDACPKCHSPLVDGECWSCD